MYRVLQFLLPAIAFALCVLLFAVLTKGSTRRRRDNRNREESLKISFSELKAQVRSLRLQLEDEARHSNSGFESLRAVSWLSPQKKSRALRLYFQGWEPAAIASELGLPRNEVELLLKLHRLRARFNDAAQGAAAVETPALQ